MILLTGATGFVGRRVLHRLLQAGIPVAAAVRASDDRKAAARLADGLASLAAYDGVPAAGGRNVPLALGADAARPYLGLPLATMDRLSATAPGGGWSADGVDAVWHLAAAIRFTPPSDEALVAENVDATRHALDIAAALGARRFVLISTAYAAGRRPSGTPAPEALHDPASTAFRNAYERSKCLSEHLVAERCAQLGIDAVILRPSIIIGSRRTFSSGGARMGLYAVLEMLCAAERTVDPAARPLRVRYDPGVALDLVPVDWVAERIVAAAQEPGRLKVRHLTAAAPTPVAAIVAAFAARTGRTPPIPVDRLPRDAGTVERRLDRQLGRFRPYLVETACFVRGRFAAPPLSPGEIDAYVAAYLHTLGANEGAEGAAAAEPRPFSPIEA